MLSKRPLQEPLHLLYLLPVSFVFSQLHAALSVTQLVYNLLEEDSVPGIFDAGPHPMQF